MDTDELNRLAAEKIMGWENILLSDCDHWAADRFPDGILRWKHSDGREWAHKAKVNWDPCHNPEHNYMFEQKIHEKLRGIVMEVSRTQGAFVTIRTAAVPHEAKHDSRLIALVIAGLKSEGVDIAYCFNEYGE